MNTMTTLHSCCDKATGIATVCGRAFTPTELRHWLLDERLKELHLLKAGNTPCSVRGELNLQSCEIKARLQFDGVIFEGPVLARDARFLREVDWTGCRFDKNLDLTDARFGGSFSLRDATIHHGLPEIASESRDWGAPLASFPQKVALDRLRVDGPLDLSRIHTNAPVDICQGNVTGNLLLYGADIGGRLFMPGLRLGGMLDSSFFKPAGATQRTHFRGHINLFQAKIEGLVFLTGAQLDGALIMQGAEIGGGVFCGVEKRTGTRTQIGRTHDGESAWLAGAKVRDNVELTGAELQGRLNMIYAEVGGSVVGLVDSQTGHRTCMGMNPDGDSARLDGMHVACHVEFAGAAMTGRPT